ncbi:AraC family transcriptional regulator [Symbioplanes lichenis]|uniref:AraC family transcriptional regulator n=1 Tax=Symbioplanes lichenis TaxID=1629072 RepID=UPI00273A3722|nr:AraC family transcriptional regulator [Actinoplanes lichenis]
MSADPIPIVRTTLESRDFEEVRDLISRRYVQHVPRVVGGVRDFVFRSRTVSAGGVLLDQPIYRACMAFETEPFETLLIASVLEGRFSVTGGRQQGRAAAGEVLLYPPGARLDIVLDHSRQWIAQLPLDVVTRVAGRLGVKPADFRFDGATPVSPQAGRRWADTVVYLARLLTSPGETGIHPLLLASAVETAAATAVTVFPNTTMALDYVSGPRRTAPAAVRRAVAYIDEHAAEPVTLEDIAGAAGLGVRALQACFRRHLDSTPVGYLFRVRLEHAHRDLQAADPAGGDTVADVAHRWGFAHLGRFAARYRDAFGQRPSETLRT